MRILNKETQLLSPGEIVTKCAEPRSYIVQTQNGTSLRRPRVHLRALQAENILNEATEHTRRRLTFREDNTDVQQVAPPVTTTGEPPRSRRSDVAGASNQTIRSDDSKATGVSFCGECQTLHDSFPSEHFCLPSRYSRSMVEEDSSDLDSRANRLGSFITQFCCVVGSRSASLRAMGDEVSCGRNCIF